MAYSIGTAYQAFQNQQDPDFVNSQSNDKLGKSSQRISVAHLISEGPIYGLVDGSSSIFINGDRVTPKEQSGVFASGSALTVSISGTTATINNAPTGRVVVTEPDTGNKFLIVRKAVGTAQVTVSQDAGDLEDSITTKLTTSSSFFTNAMISTAEGRENPLTYFPARLIPIPGTSEFIDGLQVEGFISGVTSGTVASFIPGGAGIEAAGLQILEGTYTLEIDQTVQISSYGANNVLTLSASWGYAQGPWDFDITNAQTDSAVDGPARSRQVGTFDGVTTQFRTGTIDQTGFTGQGGEGSVSISHTPVGDSAGPLQWSEGFSDTGGSGSQAPKILIATSNSGFGLSPEQVLQVDEARVTIGYASMYHVDTANDYFSGIAKYKIELSVKAPGSGGNFGPFIVLDEDRLHTANSKNSVSFVEVIDLTQFRPFTDFKVKISRKTDHNSGNAYYYENGLVRRWGTNQQSVASSISVVTSIIKENLTYPYSAMGKITFSSRDFQDAPIVTYHCRGKMVKVPSNYVTREEGVNGIATYTRDTSTGVVTNTYQDWDGAFRSRLIYTNNPAWIYFDILSNNRYGLGDFLSEFDIDIYSLYKLARYCDELVTGKDGTVEPRFTCNVYITKPSDAYKMLKDLATTFRSMVYYLDGKITLVQDAPTGPTYTFNKSNVINGSFSYEGTGSKTRSNQVVVSWNDPKNAYKVSSLIIEDSINIAETGKIISKSAVAFGCTSEGQAARFGRWKLWTAANQQELVSFETSLNAAFLVPGDVITVQDSDRNSNRYSGRVSNATPRSTTQVTLDSPVTLLSGHTYTLSIVFPHSIAIAKESLSINGVSYEIGDNLTHAFLDGTQAEVGVDNYTIHANGSKIASTSLQLSETNSNISSGDVVTGKGITGTVTVSSISGTTIVLSTAQIIEKNTLLFFGVNGTYTYAPIFNKYDSLNGKSSATATDAILAEWSEYYSSELRAVTTGSGQTSLITVSPALSSVPNPESIWLLTETTSEGLNSQSSGKEYKILSISEKGKNIYTIAGVEHYNDKFNAVDTDFTTYLEDSVYVPVTEEDIIPVPIDVYASTSKSLSGKGEDITVHWMPPATLSGTPTASSAILVDGVYSFLEGFEISHDIPDKERVEILGPGTTFHTFKDIARGGFTFSVRVVNTLGNKSRPISAEVEVTGRFQDSTISRAPEGIMMGGLTNVANTLSNTGLFSFADSIYTIQAPGSGGRSIQNAATAANTFQQSCAGLQAGVGGFSSSSIDELAASGSELGEFVDSHCYILFDATDVNDRFKLIKYNKSTSVNYWYDAGTGTTTASAGLSSISGTIQKAANSAKVIGSGTNFDGNDAEVYVGGVLNAGNFYGKIASIKDDTTLYLEESSPDAISAGTSAKTSNLSIDFLNDIIIGRVWKYDSTFNYENLLSVASLQTGQAINNVSIYRKNNSTLDSTTAGTFANPLTGNSNWSASPLSVTSNGDIVYVATRTFTSDGLSPQTSNWSSPVIHARRVDGTGATTAIGDLSAEIVNINATNAGTPLSGSLTAATTTFSIIQGSSDVSSAWTFNTPTASSGLSINVTNGNRTATVTGMTNATSSGTITFSAALSGVTITKVFTISKTNASEDGDDAVSFNMVSTTSINKNLNNAYNPTDVTAQATSRTGSNTTVNMTSGVVLNLYRNGSNSTSATSNNGSLSYTIAAGTTLVTVDMVVGGVVVDTETIPVINDGPVTIAQDGITADLTNGLHSIPADKNGLNGNYAGATCTMKIFEGTSDTTSNWSIIQTVSNGTTVTPSSNNATAAVTNMTAATTSGTVIFTATRSGYDTLSLTFTINKINAGADGTPATVFSIISSVSAISKNINNVYNPVSITATPKKIVGNSAAVTTGSSDDVTISIFKNSTGTAVQSSTNGAATYQITSGTTDIKLQLTKTSTGAVLDEEIIPVVDDGQTGQPSTVYEIDTTATAITLLNSGSFDPSTWTVSAFQTVGSGARTSFNGGTINFYKNGSASADSASGTGSSRTITISSGTTSLKAELVANSVVVASQTVRVTSEANDGNTGIAFIFDPSPSDTNGDGQPGPRNDVSDIAAIAAIITSATTGQIAVVQTTSTSDDQVAYRYNGSNWVTIALINTGLIAAQAIKAEQLQISGDSAGASRIFMDGGNNRIDVYDAGSQLRVRLGSL